MGWRALDLTRGGDRRDFVSHQAKNQAENPFCETSGDGDGQGQNGDQYKRFHWTCYRQVQAKDQRTSGR